MSVGGTPQATGLPDHGVLVLPPGVLPDANLEWWSSWWTDRDGTTTLTVAPERLEGLMALGTGPGDPQALAGRLAELAHDCRVLARALGGQDGQVDLTATAEHLTRAADTLSKRPARATVTHINAKRRTS